jgi:hypothetical protein
VLGLQPQLGLQGLDAQAEIDGLMFGGGEPGRQRGLLLVGQIGRTTRVGRGCGMPLQLAGVHATQLRKLGRPVARRDLRQHLRGLGCCDQGRDRRGDGALAQQRCERGSLLQQRLCNQHADAAKQGPVKTLQAQLRLGKEVVERAGDAVHQRMFDQRVRALRMQAPALGQFGAVGPHALFSPRLPVCPGHTLRIRVGVAPRIRPCAVTDQHDRKAAATLPGLAFDQPQGVQDGVPIRIALDEDQVFASVAGFDSSQCRVGGEREAMLDAAPPLLVIEHRLGVAGAQPGSAVCAVVEQQPRQLAAARTQLDHERRLQFTQQRLDQRRPIAVHLQSAFCVLSGARVKAPTPPSPQWRSGK